MKKYYSLGIAAICAALFSVSCEVESVAPEQSEQTPKSELTYQTFTCTIDVDETKVDIDAAGKTKWVDGDKILVHGERYGTSSSKLYSTIIELTSADLSSDGRTATIKVPVDENGVTGIVPYVHMSSGTQDYKSTLYAQYPAEASFSGSLHCYYHSVFVDTNKPLMIACDNGEGEFIFENLCGLITFTLPNSCDFDSFVFKGNSGETIGYSQYAAKRGMKMDGTYSRYNPYSGSDFTDPTNGPLTTISAPVIHDGTTMNKIFITRTIGQNNANFSKGFTIQFIKDGVIVKYASNKNEFTLKPGHQINLGDISGKLKTYVESHTPASWTSGAIDLSDNKAKVANCYVVSTSDADKVYKIPAVKGNDLTQTLNVSSVSVLWETWNSATSVTANSIVEKCDYDKNWIYFKLPASDKIHEGNAVIAAKNAANEIIWSWHIWMPKTAYTTIDGGIYKTAVMSRNLGALVDTQANADEDIDITSIGFFYQWGRKDPFVGPREILKTDDPYPSKAKVAGVERTAEKIQLSIEESIKQPTLFARGHYTGSTQDNPDWNSTSSADLWGGSGNKTIYDPCPAGYRVPKREEDYSLFTRGDITAAAGWSYNVEHFWFTLGNPATVFPCAGYMDGGSIKTVFRTLIWNGYSDSWANPDLNNISHYAGYARRIRYESSTLKYDRESKYKSLGAAVRCVVE